ncbi:MAG: potassium channel protein [Nitrospirota bacterium]
MRLDLRKVNSGRMLWLSLVAVAVVVIGGTVGYSALEGWNLLDSLFMTVITLTTIGYGEVHRLDNTGKVFTLVLILFGVGTVAFAVRNATRLMLEGELSGIFGRKKLEQKISQLNDHYIVCGFGRMGRLICRELAKKPVPYLVIERDISTVSEADRDNNLIIQGDADKDETLLRAGIKRAKGLIAVVSTDADNLYIVLTARGLNQDLYIVARAGEDGSEKKLIRAGASKVISPYLIGADRMAQAVLRPAVVDFLEFATQSENLDLKLEEISIGPESSMAGLAINQSGIRQDLGIIIVAIKRADGKMEFNPSPTSVLHGGDRLIALGQPEQMKVLEEITLGKRPKF